MVINKINSLGTYLQNQGYKVEKSICPPGCASRVDIKASKGRFGKNTLWVVVASDVCDADIAGWSLRSVRNGRKIVFLLKGDPTQVHIVNGVEIVTTLKEIACS